jgi:acetyl esterase/lipase
VEDQLRRVTLGWNHLTRQYDGITSNIAISGDSTGATLVLSLLLHSATPCSGIPTVKKKPLAALLSSPWAERATKTLPNKSDYVTKRVLERHASRIDGATSKMHDVFHSPGRCNSTQWWKRALPRLGTYIVYGTDETLSSDIEKLCLKLLKVGQVRVEAEPNQIHSWPVLMYYIGRDDITRHAGIDKLAATLARFLPWARTN